jgi:hypothetical protein
LYLDFFGPVNKIGQWNLGAMDEQRPPESDRRIDRFVAAYSKAACCDQADRPNQRNTRKNRATFDRALYS